MPNDTSFSSKSKLQGVPTKMSFFVGTLRSSNSMRFKA